MFGGFGGGGFGGPPPGQQPGFPGMQANVNVTQTTTTSSTSHKGGMGMHAGVGMGGPGGPGGPGGAPPGGARDKARQMRERFEHREGLLPTYNALVDVLESKGENVIFPDNYSIPDLFDIS